MTFLNPALLWGLAAVSIPIIIHIFNLKRTKKIEFSTLMFLKEIQQSKYKRIKLKQLLILLCRIAFIILLALMFSRPFQQGYISKAGAQTTSTVLILLDDSFSMQTRNTGGSDFDIAKTRITETMDMLGDNDEIMFSTVSSINKGNKNFLYKDKNSLKDSLALIKTSDITRNLNEVLYYSNKILQNSSNSIKEVFLFTDGQKTFIDNPVNSEIKIDDNTRLNIVLIGSRPPNNISMDTLNITTRIFERNKYVKIKCTLNNHNNYNLSNKSVQLNFNDGRVRDEKAIDIPANSSVDVEFTFKPNVSGYAGGFIEVAQTEIADDEITNDNKRYFSFYIPKKVNLLFVSSSPSDLNYVRLALSSSEEAMKDSSGVTPKYYNIRQIGENGLTSENLDAYNCIVIANKSSFTNAETDALSKFLNTGKGVLIFPGNKTSVSSYNDNLLRTLSLPIINNTFGDINSEPKFKFSDIDLEHPIFDGIFKQNAKDNILRSSPKIKSGFDLTSGVNTKSIIRLDNEKSYLNEYTLGLGRILIYSSSPDMTMSDFPMSNLFSPVIVRSVLYLSNKIQNKEAVTGKDYFTELNSTDTLKLVNSYKKDGLVSLPVGHNEFIDLKKYFNSSSNYLIEDKGTTTSSFSANFDKAETKPEIFSSKEISALITDKYKTEANVIEANKPVTASLIEFREGRELWQFFLIGALLFLLVEFLLARSIMKSK